MSVSIEIKGINKLMAKLSRAAAIDVLEKSMQRAVFRVQARIADYPPQRAGSAYRRTGTLGRRWTTKVTKQAEGVEGRVGNVTEYAPFVQSARFQRPPFRGRWQTDEQVLEEEMPAIRRDFEQEIDKALKG